MKECLRPGAPDMTDDDLAPYALAACGRCEELVPCRKWLDGLPRDEWPYGVVAGVRIGFRPNGRLAPRTRPVKATPTWLLD